MTYVWLNDRSAGPFDDATLEVMLRGHAVSGETLAWREGLTEWGPLSSLASAAQPADAGQSLAVDCQVTIANQEALLAAVDGNSTEVRSEDLATVVATRLAPGVRLGSVVDGNASLTLYRWPQFGPELGVYPAGQEPPRRTAANGTCIGRDEFMAILAKAEAWDIKTLFDLADICFENGDIQADPVVAALLRSRGEYYFATAVAEQDRIRQAVARPKSTLNSI